jgi:ABC-type multidrug transport system permease subunit
MSLNDKIFWSCWVAALLFGIIMLTWYVVSERRKGKR